MQYLDFLLFILIIDNIILGAGNLQQRKVSFLFWQACHLLRIFDSTVLPTTKQKEEESNLPMCG